MENQNDPNRLLDDVLEEAISPSFRDALLEQTLRQVRRRRRVRRVAQNGLAAALLVSLAALFWKSPPRDLPSPAPAVVVSEPPAVGIVSSQPLDPSRIIQTQVSSANIIVTSATALDIIETQPAPELFKEVNDQELLALLADRPVALVRYSPDFAEVVFLDPADRPGLPLP